jgi:endonuclease-8
MPEGDSIFRAARSLHQALAGRTVSRFESVFPQLNNAADGGRTRGSTSGPLTGQTVERVDARGKHLLIWFSGGLVLRTHMRMHGTWHIYRPGERWQRPRHEMRIVLATPEYVAVAFNVPVAEFETADTLAHAEPLRELGPDLLRDDFDATLAVQNIQARPDMEIADALLDQHAIAGIGNIYKSESLFASGTNPFTRVSALRREQIERVVALATRLMRASATDSRARFRVYERGGKPCRRCGTPIQRTKQGPHARSTYWCPRCQPSAGPT